MTPSKIIKAAGRSLNSVAPVCEHDVPYSSARSWYVIEAVQLINLCVQRSRHDQPHDHLDAFGSRFAHIIDVWNPREAFRITSEPVQKGFVPVRVYQPRACALELVRQTARPENDDVELFLE
jgi:hypothetical protein